VFETCLECVRSGFRVFGACLECVQECSERVQPVQKSLDTVCIHFTNYRLCGLGRLCCSWSGSRVFEVCSECVQSGFRMGSECSGVFRVCSE
jgi:hypothetical protein